MQRAQKEFSLAVAMCRSVGACTALKRYPADPELSADYLCSCRRLGENMGCDLNVAAVRPAGDDVAMVKLDFDDIDMASGEAL